MSVIFSLPGTKSVVVSASVSCSGKGEPIFGCHANGIRDIAVTFSVASDPLNELTDKWGQRLQREHKNICTRVLKENKDLRYAMFREFAAGFKDYSLVFMTAPCNTDDGIPDITHHLHGVLATAGFAQFLKDEGEFIMASPLLTNWQHIRRSFSLLRGWMWVPTHNQKDIVRHIEGTEYISGKMKSGVPLEEWKAFYKELHSRTTLNTDERVGTEVHPGHLRPFVPADLIG